MDLTAAHRNYQANGFAIIRDVLPEDLIREAQSHVEWLLEKYSDLRPEHLHHPLIRNDSFWVRLVTDSRLVDIAEYFLGPDIACFTAHYICKPAFDGQPVLWHQDGAYWKLEPMQALTVWVAVDDSNTGNGCLQMIPGSHVLPLQPPEPRLGSPNMLYSSSNQELVDQWINRNGIVPVELRPGDVSIHHPNILHCSAPNTSGSRRCGLDIGYISTSTRILSDGLYLDPILVRGAAIPGVNTYRPYPTYEEGESIPFGGHQTWNEYAVAVNAAHGLSEHTSADHSPIESAQLMIERLRAGTTKR